MNTGTMRCLVTGGAGFIGANLALSLEAKGHEVIVIDSFHSAHRSNLRNFRGPCIQADVSEPFDFPGKVDVIFHQAAITDPRYGNDEEVLKKNVGGFERVLEISEKQGARLVYASTAGLYGNGPIPMQEDQPQEILTAYGLSKSRMDERALAFSSKAGIVGLRYFNVFGPLESHKGRPASMVYHLWRQMREGKRPRVFTEGHHRRDFVYVKDVVTANLCAVTGKPGIYNVGTGVGSSFNDLIRVLNRVLETDLAPEYFEMPFDDKTYQHHTIADTTRAKSGLGFSAEWDLERAVRNYVSFLNSALDC